jgi:hypothetical protein
MAANAAEGNCTDTGSWDGAAAGAPLAARSNGTKAANRLRRTVLLKFTCIGLKLLPIKRRGASIQDVAADSNAREDWL